MAQDNKYYTIKVGGKPAKVQVGSLGDDGKPVGTPVEAEIQKGAVAVPNYSMAWCRRIMDKKDAPTGELEFLEWGDPKGEQREIRYLPNSRSLDVAFQREVEKLVKFQDKDSELQFEIGLNNFDPTRDKLKILMIKHHYQNGTNKSRPPKGVAIAFTTYDPQTEKLAMNTDRLRRQEAEQIVMNTDFNDGSLEILAVYFKMDPREQPDILYENLMALTDNYGHFLESLDHYRKEWEGIMIKARECDLVNFGTGNDLVLIEKGQKLELCVNLETGLMDVQNYVLKNHYNPIFYKALAHIKKALTNYTESVLQN